MITPTMLSYEAWQRTTRPIPYDTRDGKGNSIRVLVDLTSPQTHQYYKPDLGGTCAICGSCMIGGVPTTKMLGGSYTDWQIHRAPESENICEACVWAMSMNMDSGRQTLYRYSFVASVTDGLKICNPQQMRDALIDPPEPPFVMVVAVSQKKHLVTKAKIGYSKERFPCMLEEECVQVERQKNDRLIRIIEALRGLGATKNEIGQANFRYERLRAWGAENYERAADILMQYRRDRQMALALHVAQKNESEEDARCYLDFKPMI